MGTLLFVCYFPLSRVLLVVEIALAHGVVAAAVESLMLLILRLLDAVDTVYTAAAGTAVGATAVAVVLGGVGGPARASAAV